jgi:hypothetical protein
MRILRLCIHELESASLSGLALLTDSHQDKAGHVVRRHRVSSPEQRAEEICKIRPGPGLGTVKLKSENKRKLKETQKICHEICTGILLCNLLSQTRSRPIRKHISPSLPKEVE